jgi:elongation factor P
MINTGELKKGLAINLEDQLYYIEDYQHVKLGRGSAFVRVKLRNIRQGHITEKTFQAGERFQRAILDRGEVQFLYREDNLFYFMNTSTYEQFPVDRNVLGNAVNFLKEGAEAELLTYRDEAIAIELPTSVDLKVEQTDPGFKGDTATGGTKPARLETGLTVNVPLFVNTDDVIRVDTRTGTYIERVM